MHIHILYFWGCAHAEYSFYKFAFTYFLTLTLLLPAGGSAELPSITLTVR